MIIPAFEAEHPEIDLRFRPTAPTDYDAALKARLDSGTAGDLIACRPFDPSLALYRAGHLAGLDDLTGIASFPTTSRSAWQTDDGSVTFCVPVASVIHGFLYNRDAFRELDLEAPRTEEAFFAVLDRIRADGRWVPLALGLRDRWEAATVGYDNIGPNYWKGETGRRALIAGTHRLTDEPWAAPFRTLARWRPYLGEGHEARGYRDSQELFVSGHAAIYPAGSWEITGFNTQARFAMGAFRPPVREAGDTCYISDHLDMAIGLNAASPNKEAARAFLNWIASARFASLYATALPGFFPLSVHPVALDDPLAETFLSWRRDCRSTVRFASQFLSRGSPDLTRATWDAAAAAMSGLASAEEVAARLQEGLAAWYAPQQ